MVKAGRSIGSPPFPFLRAYMATALALSAAFSEDLEDSSRNGRLPTTELKRMSLEDLMDIEVTLVSKHVEKLDDAASAIQVITHEEIRRIGARTLPEVLRLASNLQVAQLDSRQWTIGARGFNTGRSNKLLVMIDGRTLYSPLYGGVFWDAQHVVMEDIDRIEVISGPGGTLWGSNAVNGVINIVTRTADKTQGLYLAGGGGTLMRDFGAARYGSRLGSHVTYRVHGKRIDFNATEREDGADGKSAWGATHGGIRLDWTPSQPDHVSLQMEGYGAEMGQTAPGKTAANGQYLLTRWQRDLSKTAGVQLQVFADRTYREIAGTGSEQLVVYDVDFQTHSHAGDRHQMVWGIGYRMMQDDVENDTALTFKPEDRALQLFNAYAQDELSLLHDRLRITLGLKYEHNYFSGSEIMPSGRVAYSPRDNHTVWGAVSRLVRSPNRLDVDYNRPALGGEPAIEGGPNFTSEKIVAYELGYRLRPHAKLTLSVAGFYNWYLDLRVQERKDSSLPVVYQFRNGMKGVMRGVEISGKLQATDWWRLNFGYNFLEEDFRAKAGHIPRYPRANQGSNPAHQASLASLMQLPRGFGLNGTARYVDHLPQLASPSVPAYFTYDLMANWNYGPWEVKIIGQNLAAKRHAEFGSEATRQYIPRSFAGNLSLRL